MFRHENVWKAFVSQIRPLKYECEMCAWYHTKHLVKLDLMTFPLIPCIDLFVSVHAMIQVSFQRS